MSARGRGEFYFNRDLAVRIAEALEDKRFAVRLINLDGAETGLETRAAQARGADFCSRFTMIPRNRGT